MFRTKHNFQYTWLRFFLNNLEHLRFLFKRRSVLILLASQTNTNFISLPSIWLFHSSKTSSLPPFQLQLFYHLKSD